MMVVSERDARDWLASRHADAMVRLDLLVSALCEENERQNLVSRSSLESVWQRHILDSAQLLHVYT